MSCLVLDKLPNLDHAVVAARGQQVRLRRIPVNTVTVLIVRLELMMQQSECLRVGLTIQLTCHRVLIVLEYVQ